MSVKKAAKKGLKVIEGGIDKLPLEVAQATKPLKKLIYRHLYVVVWLLVQLNQTT